MIKKTIKATEENLYDAAELFKVFGDSTRIRILYLLLDGEKSVNEIADALQMTLCHIPSIAYLKAERSRRIETGRQEYLLCPLR